jgi:hypothetical protein
MPREFSDNSNRLLKDSLTLETPGFTWEIAVPELRLHATAADFNDLFTMNQPGDDGAQHRACGP